MVVNIIKEKISSADNGTLFFNNSFPEYDDEYVGKILSDLVKSGDLYHLSRGVYLKTEQTRFGLVYPPVSAIASAIAERDKAQILPTGATALNLLGLSTQMPMNPVFLTSGSARKIIIDGIQKSRSEELCHQRAKTKFDCSGIEIYQGERHN